MYINVLINGNLGLCIGNYVPPVTHGVGTFKESYERPGVTPIHLHVHSVLSQD